MPLVFENPPSAPRGIGGVPGAVRERSPLRKEIDALLAELSAYPDRWARLYDFTERQDAEKRATQVRTAAGKGWNIATRQQNGLWSVFARTKPVSQDGGEEAVREPTFQ